MPMRECVNGKDVLLGLGLGKNPVFDEFIFPCLSHNYKGLFSRRDAPKSDLATEQELWDDMPRVLRFRHAWRANATCDNEGGEPQITIGLTPAIGATHVDVEDTEHIERLFRGIRLSFRDESGLSEAELRFLGDWRGRDVPELKIGRADFWHVYSRDVSLDMLEVDAGTTVRTYGPEVNVKIGKLWGGVATPNQLEVAEVMPGAYLHAENPHGWLNRVNVGHMLGGEAWVDWFPGKKPIQLNIGTVLGPDQMRIFVERTHTNIGKIWDAEVNIVDRDDPFETGLANILPGDISTLFVREMVNSTLRVGRHLKIIWVDNRMIWTLGEGDDGELVIDGEGTELKNLFVEMSMPGMISGVAVYPEDKEHRVVETFVNSNGELAGLSLALSERRLSSEQPERVTIEIPEFARVAVVTLVGQSPVKIEIEDQAP